MSFQASLLTTLHLLAAAFWVGGMAVLQFAVRPAAAVALPGPPQRLALMAALLQRFFFGVTLSIAVLLITGFAIVLSTGGMAAQPLRVHAMLGLGLLMMGGFAYVRLALYPRLQHGVAKADWPAAGAALNAIRKLVALNLALGIVVFAVAVLGRAF